jgi:hypothetical protein
VVEEKETTVTVDAIVVAQVLMDAVEDEARIILARPMQQREVFLPIYGQKSAADQMRTSWENLVQYFGTNYGQDINN